MPFLPDREEALYNVTVRIPTSVGTMFATVTYNDNLEIIETIINVGKTGAETHTMAEALGRLVSMFLRHDCTHSHDERLEEVIRQLEGVTATARGNGTSVPDSLAKALKEARDVIEQGSK